MNAAAAGARPVSGVAIRRGLDSDLDELNRIYNHYVATSQVTFDIEPITIRQRRESSKCCR